MSDKPKLAKEIKVSRHGLQVDGEEFPWHVALGGTHVSVSREELPGVTVTIVADRVLVDDDMDAQVTGHLTRDKSGATQEPAREARTRWPALTDSAPDTPEGTEP